jgi:hypothetical protein
MIVKERNVMRHRIPMFPWVITKQLIHRSHTNPNTALAAAASPEKTYKLHIQTTPLTTSLLKQKEHTY